MSPSVLCVASVRSIFIRSRFPLETRPDTQACGHASTTQILLKYCILTVQIQQIQIVLCNTLPKTTLILKYYENTVRIPHKTRSDTQACGNAEKEEVRTMSELAGITLEYGVLY